MTRATSRPPQPLAPSLRHPSEAIRSRARGDTAGHRPGLEIDNGHVVVPVHRDERADTVRSNENALGTASQRDALDFLARGRVENNQIARLEVRDQCEL